MILPYLTYGIINWGHLWSRLEKTQKKAVRTVAKAKFNAHTEPLMKRLKILKIKDLYDNSLYKFYHRLIHQAMPPAFENISLITHGDSHIYYTRQSDLLTYNNDRLSLTDVTLKVKVPRTYNNSHPLVKKYIVEMPIQQFKGYLKAESIRKYEYECKIRRCYICNN